MFLKKNIIKIYLKSLINDNKFFVFTKLLPKI